MINLDLSHPIHIHFIGIGGISMSGLAHILLDKGFPVSGSDLKASELTHKLEMAGAEIYIGHSQNNITDSIKLVVYTAAIHPDNPEYKAAKDKNITLITRAEMWGLIMRNYEAAIAISGTHGKTTTTSMLSEICVNAELDPTITVGGILPAIGGNLRVGAHKVFITEACEYCNSFLSFNPTIGIILNIEEDHLDFFKDIDDIRLSFRNFVLKLPASGLLIINSAIDNYNYITEGLACPFVTFGLDTSSTYSAQNISYDHRGCAQFDLYKLGQFLTHIHLSVPGEHNIIDALASCAAADALSIQKDDFTSSLNGFHGTERRFEYKGSLGDIQIYDDYAHHPTEITATISAARKVSCSRLVIVFQPHTYTRTKAFLTEFAEALSHADLVILTDIYAAREKNTIGISSKDIQTEINKLGTKCLYFSSFDAVEKFLLENSINGDLLITMGAGDVVNIGENLLGI